MFLKAWFASLRGDPDELLHAAAEAGHLGAKLWLLVKQLERSIFSPGESDFRLFSHKTPPVTASELLSGSLISLWNRREPLRAHDHGRGALIRHVKSPALLLLLADLMARQCVSFTLLHSA